jgi:hypothetical protein
MAPEQESKSTTDHQEIRKWVEERNGVPTTVKGTPAGGEDAGILRIHFPEYSGEEKLEQISWEDFFDKFEEQKLKFFYQEETKSGGTSRFFKFTRR